MTTSKLPILAVMERKDSSALGAHLGAFRERGIVNFTKALMIPMDQRIPALVGEPNGRQRVSVALSSSIVSAFSNIKNAKMSADQIIELAEGIIDSAHEDQLAIEDVLLFLKDMLMGKYGKFSQGLDMPGFFEAFEDYRNERYRTLKNIEWEQHLTAKSMGHCSRSFDELPLKRDDDPGTMIDLMQTYYEGREANGDD